MRLSADFRRWRYPGRTNQSYREYVAEGRRGREVRFSLKAIFTHDVRGARIGAIRANTDDPWTWHRALRALLSDARRDEQLAYVTMSTLSGDSPQARLLAAAGFVPLRTTLPLIVKPVAAGGRMLERARWSVSDEDSDVWVAAADVRATTEGAAGEPATP
jgi:hypothetical protein